MREEYSESRGTSGPGQTMEELFASIGSDVRSILEKALCGGEISVDEGIALFDTRGRELEALLVAADRMRKRKVGDFVSFVIVRNINFTNVCYTGCRFCAFAKRKDDPEAEFLSFAEIKRRTQEAWGSRRHGGMCPGWPPS